MKWLIANEPVTPQVILYWCNIVDNSLWHAQSCPELIGNHVTNITTNVNLA